MEGDGQIAPTNDDDCPIIYRIVTKTVLRMCLVDDVVQVFAMKCHSIKSMWSAGHLLEEDRGNTTLNECVQGRPYRTVGHPKGGRGS